MEAVADLEVIEAVVRSYCARFDSFLLDPPEASVVAGAAGRIKRMMAAIEADAARVYADSQVWKKEGFRSAEEWLASKSGTTPSQAKEALNTARRVGEHPLIADAVKRGE